MNRRIVSLVLALVLAFGMIPVTNAAASDPSGQLVPQPLVEGVCAHSLRDCVSSPDYYRPDFEGLLIGITPQRVEDTFAYLNEHYVQNYPEAALEMNTGSEEDREALKALAEIITAGCDTNREKADAIDQWLRANIIYDANASAYATDTLFDRVGNCMSYANLMQYLLRSLGIPAVVGDGWRGNMAEQTVELFDYAGHAWCFVLLDGEWVLYDPLWLEGGTNDRQYIQQWIYLDTVEYITPAYDSENLPPEAWDKPKVYYTDGTFYNYSNSYPTGFGNFTMTINNMPINFTPCQDESSIGGSTDGMIYLDGRDKSDMELGEVYRDGWIAYGNAKKERHLALTYAYSNGMQVSGSVDTLNDTLYYMDGFYSYPIEADDDVWSIQYGTFTLPTGYTGEYLDFPFGERIFLEGGTVTVESLNPEIATVNEENEITTYAEGICDIQYKLVRQSGTVYSVGHITVLVSDTERVLEYNPFADVEDGKYYYDPVLWAYEKGITAGTSDTSFSPNKDCTRGQIVTFLWRAAGCPEPVSADNPFTDVDADDYFYQAVLWAVEQGVTAGATKTTFNPKGACNRAQVVTFMYRAAGSPTVSAEDNPFGDVAGDKYYCDAVLWAVENGITAGVSATRFAPNNTCTRGQIVTFLYRGYGED